jgi:vesicle-fusing ATPase
MEKTGREQIGVGVKQVLLAVELAKMDQGNVMGRFAELIKVQMQRAEEETWRSEKVLEIRRI